MSRNKLTFNVELVTKNVREITVIYSPPLTDKEAPIDQNEYPNRKFYVTSAQLEKAMSDLEVDPQWIEHTWHYGHIALSSVNFYRQIVTKFENITNHDDDLDDDESGGVTV